MENDNKMSRLKQMSLAPNNWVTWALWRRKKKLISDYDNNSNQGEINRFKVVKNDKIFQPHTTAESTVNDPGML